MPRTPSTPDDDIFVTTKVWNTDHGYDETLRAFDKSTGLLGIDEVDLYLIHWPSPKYGKHVESWETMIEVRDAGLERQVVARPGERPHAARGAQVGLDRQFTATAVHQHRQLDAGRTAIVKQLVDDRARGAAGVEHVIDQHDVTAFDLERQVCRIARDGHAAATEIVAVQG